MLQMLQNIQNQRVHILNLGFNSKWIIDSFKKTRPDKIYLVRKEEETKDAEKTEKEIKRYTQKAGIDTKFIINENEMFTLISQLKEIFIKEKGNLIYLAISSGPRQNTSAFIISSMLFGNNVKEICLYSMKEGDFIQLPHFQVRLPKKEVLEAINFLESHEKDCTKKKLRDYLFENKILKLGKCKDIEHTKYVKLNRTVLEPAEKEWKFIEISGKRKGSIITLTEEGKKWAKIF